MTEVKHVSFQVHRLNEKNQQKVRQYLKAQNNIQKTLEFQMLYFQERFGDVDIMDYDVQRELFADFENKVEIKSAEVKPVIKESFKEKINYTNKDNDLANNVNSDDF